MNKLILGLIAAATVGFAIGNKPLEVDNNSSAELFNKIDLTNIPVAESKVELISQTFQVKSNLDYCPRNTEGHGGVVTHIMRDFEVPQHCLEKDCGLGVYSKQQEDEVERCSYCGAIKPTNL